MSTSTVHPARKGFSDAERSIIGDARDALVDAATQLRGLADLSDLGERVFISLRAQATLLGVMSGRPGAMRVIDGAPAEVQLTAPEVPPPAPTLRLIHGGA